MEDVPIRTRFRDEGSPRLPLPDLFSTRVAWVFAALGHHATPVTLCHLASLAATVIGFIPEKLMLY